MMRSAMMGLGVIGAALILQGCASRPERQLPPCTPSSAPNDICDPVLYPPGVSYPRQPDRGDDVSSQARRDIERHRNGGAQPGG